MADDGSEPRQDAPASSSGSPFRVGISGSYGGLNLGDESILHAMISQLRQAVPVEITVFSKDPEDTLRRHHVEKAVPVRKLSREEVLPHLEPLDLLLLGGGGILFDAEAKLYLREVVLAQELGIPVMVYAVGAGPLKDPAMQDLVTTCLDRAALITVRERGARQVLEEVGVHGDVVVTADPALLLEAEDLPDDRLKQEGLEGHRRLVGFSVREPGAAAPDLDQNVYHSLLANAADFMVDRLDAHIVFVPMERQVLDVQHCHAVVAQMRGAQRATVLKGEYTSRQMLRLVGHLDFAVGMRLHFLIFAAIAGIPFVALPYAPKVTGFLEDLEIDVPPLREVTAGRLIAYIDRSWDIRQSLRRRVQEKMPALKERARETHRLAVRLLTEGRRRRTSPRSKG